MLVTTRLLPLSLRPILRRWLGRGRFMNAFAILWR
jgi:hypothetical protein